jgi:hypothetical protein
MIRWNKPVSSIRVELPAWSDEWMTGHRFGLVTGERHDAAGRLEYRVKPEKSDKVCRFLASELHVILSDVEYDHV